MFGLRTREEAVWRCFLNRCIQQSHADENAIQIPGIILIHATKEKTKPQAVSVSCAYRGGKEFRDLVRLRINKSRNRTDSCITIEKVIHPMRYMSVIPDVAQDDAIPTCTHLQFRVGDSLASVDLLVHTAYGDMFTQIHKGMVLFRRKSHCDFIHTVVSTRTF